MFTFGESQCQTPEQLDEAVDAAREALARAAHVLVGAGAGLSAAAGLGVAGPRFEEHFGPFIERYGIGDLYSGGFYPFSCEEDRWAWWGEHLWLETHDTAPNPLYAGLLAYLRGRDHFVLTTNVDRQFELAGFSAQRVFATQGAYGWIQCASGCHQKIYDARDQMAAIHAHLARNGSPTRITDPDLVPVCPVCGGPMNPWLRVDAAFVQDDDWYAAGERYERFLGRCDLGSTVLLELGVGYNTPVIIRYPFERMAQRGATLIRMNYDSAGVDPSVPGGIGLQGDIAALWPRVAGGDAAAR